MTIDTNMSATTTIPHSYLADSPNAYDFSRRRLDYKSVTIEALSIPKILRRFAAQVCRQWRIIVQNHFLSALGKAFPTNPMDESNWGSPVTIALAEPRIIQWQLGPNDTNESKDNYMTISRMATQEYYEYQQWKKCSVSNHKQLTNKDEASAHKKTISLKIKKTK
ncbi:hypothetical protein FBU30_000408 [Linnemannia zychae]|nr:hypothetical protein FBU30_000408 [Linnemannia zychae]